MEQYQRRTLSSLPVSDGMAIDLDMIQPVTVRHGRTKGNAGISGHPQAASVASPSGGIAIDSDVCNRLWLVHSTSINPLCFHWPGTSCQPRSNPP